MQFLLWIVAGYAALCLLVYLVQGRLVFFPVRGISATPERVGLAYEDVWLTTEAGQRVHAWWIPQDDARPAVVFFHGNAGNVSHRLETVRILHRLGLATLIFDYPGYGRSEGSPSEHGCYEAGRAALAHVRSERDIEDVVLWGRSLGAAVALQVASESAPSALILESAFTSLPSMAQRVYPWLPARWLCKFRFASIDHVRTLTCPKLFFHGTGDRVVPLEEGRRLFEAAAEPKRFVELEGGHDDAFLVSSSRYLRAVQELLDEHVR